LDALKQKQAASPVIRVKEEGLILLGNVMRAKLWPPDLML